jgi:hypothetical protein
MGELPLASWLPLGLGAGHLDYGLLRQRFPVHQDYLAHPCATGPTLARLHAPT